MIRVDVQEEDTFFDQLPSNRAQAFTAYNNLDQGQRLLQLSPRNYSAGTTQVLLHTADCNIFNNLGLSSANQSANTHSQPQIKDV